MIVNEKSMVASLGFLISMLHYSQVRSMHTYVYIPRLLSEYFAKDITDTQLGGGESRFKTKYGEEK